jgi:DNA repair photolyase
MSKSPAPYTTPLTVTSQFSFCGLPLRFDSYAGCAFRCSYCFARHRGGNNYGDSVRGASQDHLARSLHRAFNDDAGGLVAQFLRRRVPIHMGGMSDPFQPIERRYRVTEASLRALSQQVDYPVVISTRSTLVSELPYMDVRVPDVLIGSLSAGTTGRVRFLF